jgi:hypothetical protein
LIIEYTNESTQLTILLLKNSYLKPKYIKSILIKDSNLISEKPLEFKDISIKDIDKQCKNYIKKYK